MMPYIQSWCDETYQGVVKHHTKVTGWLTSSHTSTHQPWDEFPEMTKTSVFSLSLTIFFPIHSLISPTLYSIDWRHSSMSTDGSNEKYKCVFNLYVYVYTMFACDVTNSFWVHSEHKWTKYRFLWDSPKQPHNLENTPINRPDFLHSNMIGTSIFNS